MYNLAQTEESRPKMTVGNYKQIVGGLIRPHKEMIAQAALHFKKTMQEYQSKSQQRPSVQMPHSYYAPHRSPSLLSDYSVEPEWQTETEGKISPEPTGSKDIQFQEWKFSVKPSFANYSNLSKYYEEIFFAKKCVRRNKRDFYDFKVDEKEMLIKIFKEISTGENEVKFEAIAAFFQQCPLFYLCYNIKPTQLLDLLKDSAHQFSDRLTLLEFLNVFFIDRPSITCLFDNESIKIAKQCILSQQNWKQLKGIFNTLDTFGNETISMEPFLFKIKNNHTNRHLINEPAVEYPEIGRTIPLKKIIFNLENRYKFQEKITWPEIEAIIRNFKYESEPTIDIIYKRMIERGRITKFSNYFMIKTEVIDQIKAIFNRCPKYCQYFVKTKFLLNQLLEAPKIKKDLREAVVRMTQVGSKEMPTTLQDQIRLIFKNAENYIDLDELLEYFTIKGPINTQADAEANFDQSDSDDGQETVRFNRLREVRSADRLRSLKKSKKYPKPIRHLTICEEFKLSTKQKQAIMDRRTREWQENKEKEIQRQLRRKFKANPIPAELNPERYQEYAKAMEEAKALKRQQFMKKKEKQNQVYQYLKTNTKLFTAKENIKTEPSMPAYKFTPKPIPWHIVDINLLQTINEQKQQRRKNILSQNKVKIVRQWRKLPDVMQDYEDLAGNDSLQNEANTSRNSSIETQRKKMQKQKVKDVPDFKKLHAQFEEELSKKKKNFVPTIPVAPHFTIVKKKQVTFQTYQGSRAESIATKHRPTSVKHKVSVQTCIAKPVITIPTTKKYLGMVNFNQQKLQQKQLQKIRMEEQELQRKSKQYNFARFMQKKLKKSLHKTVSLTSLTQNKVQSLKRQWRSLKKQNQEELYQMYSRVMARPFLFETKPEGQNGQAKLPSKPTLKKVKAKPAIWKKQSEKKHIHQSPLKQFEPDQQSPSPPQAQPKYLKYQPQSQSQQSGNKAYLMNQSF